LTKTKKTSGVRYSAQTFMNKKHAVKTKTMSELTLHS